jgi:hypothetical protein
VWRVGHASSPLEYPPHPGWINRFDDRRQRFRSLYCARYQITSLREVLDGFSADLKALKAFKDIFGTLPPAAGTVPWGWREEKALAPARIDILEGDLVRLDDLTVRRQLELDSLDFLVSHGVERLDISRLLSKDRTLTQEIAGILFDRGAAGIVYRSNLDDHLCAALFEGRARLVSDGDSLPLDEPVRALKRATKELGLILTPRSDTRK